MRITKGNYYSKVNKLRKYEYSTHIYLSDFMTMRNYEDQLQNHLVHSVNWTNEPRYVIFQQCGILTSVDSDEPVQPPFKLRKFQVA